jgi:surfeit locus 1 family protein
MLLHRLLPRLRPRPLMTCVPSSVPRTTALTTVWRRTLTTETSSTTSGSYTVKKRKFGLGTAILCTIPFITFGLGTWQVQRLRWKVNLIERLEERMFQDPIPLPRRIK